MNAIDYRSLAEEWLEHVGEQYELIHICRKDLLLIEYLLKRGFTLMALRDESNVLRVDFLVKRGRERKKLHSRRP